MWRKWFNRSILKSLDENRAEASEESETGSGGGGLCMQTGEVWWEGAAKREREEAQIERQKAKEKKMQSEPQQKSLGGRYKVTKLQKERGEGKSAIIADEKGLPRHVEGKEERR